MNTMKKGSRQILLLGLMAFPLFLGSLLLEGVSHITNLRATDTSYKVLSSLCFGVLYFAVINLSQSKHRLALPIAICISVLGYIAVFVFLSWILLNMLK